MDIFLPFFITSLIIELTPGPNMGYLAVLSASRGRRAGFATVAGVAAGLSLIGIAAALGVAALVESSPALYQVLRWGGVFYMLYLAWESWWPEKETTSDRVLDQDIRHFWRGFVTNVLNPKAAMFYVAVLPSFVQDAADLYFQTIVLTAIYVFIATAIHAAIVAVSGTAQNFLKHPRRRDIVRKIFSIMLAGIAIWFAVKTGI